MLLEEPFAVGDSVLHRCDPRVKVILAFSYAMTIAVLRSPPVAGAALVVSVVLALIARLSLTRLAARLLVANVFIAFLWLVLPWSFGRTAIWSVGPLHVTREGITESLLITLKCNAILLSFLALIGTSRVFDVGHALIRLGVPRKLVLVLFFCFRYLHVIHGEYHRLVGAMAVRGFRPSTGLHTYRSYANLVGALLVHSHDRATRVYQAMLCRGFNGHFPVVTHGRLRALDLIIAGALGALVVLLGVWQWQATT